MPTLESFYNDIYVSVTLTHQPINLLREKKWNNDATKELMKLTWGNNLYSYVLFTHAGLWSFHAHTGFLPCVSMPVLCFHTPRSTFILCSYPALSMLVLCSHPTLSILLLCSHIVSSIPLVPFSYCICTLLIPFSYCARTLLFPLSYLFTLTLFHSCTVLKPCSFHALSALSSMLVLWSDPYFSMLLV